MAKSHNDGRKKTRQPRFLLPDLARVPRLEVSDDTLFRGAPEIAANAGVRTDARLRDVAKSIQNTKNISTLMGDTVTGSGTTGRGLLGNACSHYLGVNRFGWWDAVVPATGAIGSGSDETTLETVFCNEFCSSLATVVGADLDGSSSTPARKVSWDMFQVGSSPNNIPHIEFSLRTVRPTSIPTIMLASVYTRDSGSAQVLQKVIYNCVEEGCMPDPAQPRPPLIIDFVVPQRAVGLEFGFLGEDHRIINPEHVQLIARNRDGEEIFTAQAYRTVNANSVRGLIGVRDQNGAISSVELRFEHPEYTILELQLIYRIWHEPLPPAAVRQGAVETVWYGPNDGRNLETRACEPLPFHCGSYIPMVRGFRLEFLDGEPHEVSSLSIRLDDVRHDRSCEGGQVELVARGGIGANDVERSYNAYKIKIYYTLLAWDSTQMDVNFTRVTIGGLGLQHSFGKIIVDDPCSLSREWEAPGQNVCGEVDGFMRSYGCTAYHDQMERMSFWLDIPYRTRGHYPRSSLVTSEPVGISVDIDGASASNKTSLLWTMESTIEGDHEGRTRWDMSGTLITGPSVVRPFSSILDSGSNIEVNLRSDVRRADREWFFTPDDVANLNLIAPMEADMTFVSPEFFNFGEIDEIQALDVEVKGDSYDGSRVNWKMGFESEGHFAVAWPRFGGLVRRIRRPRTTLSKRDVRFDNAIVDVVTLMPDQFGFVRNEGNIPVFINELTWGGQYVREFSPRFEYRGEVLSETELANRAPLRLDPGEALTIGGRFFTIEGGDTERSAWLEFRTNSMQTPYVHVDLSAQLVPSQAEGEWFPPMYNFGNVEVGYDETHVASINSKGRSPLIVRSLAIKAPPGSVMRADTGFSFTGASATNRYQIEAGGFLDLRITFTPTTAGQVEVLLVAETNAGTLGLRLLGEGVAH